MTDNLVLLVAVAIGGALGGAARFAVSSIAGRWLGHPAWGTFAVNASGSFLLGMLAGVVALEHTADWLFLAVGLLGSYTTVSAFSLQTLVMLQEGQAGRAALSAAGSVTVCLGCAALGVRLAGGLV